jgi:hypothetical protein
MAKLFPKNEDEQFLVDEEKSLLTEDDGEDETALVLQKLGSEEASLREQKENLSSLKEQLQLRVKEEIDLRRSSIQKLKTEITDLKGECEKLSKSLRSMQTGQHINSE